MPGQIKFAEKDGAKLATLTVRAPGKVKTFGVVMKPGTRAQVEKAVRDWARKTNQEIANWSAAGNTLSAGADPDAPMSPTMKAAQVKNIKNLAKKLSLDPDAVLTPSFTSAKSPSKLDPDMVLTPTFDKKTQKKVLDKDAQLTPTFERSKTIEEEDKKIASSLLKRPDVKVSVDPKSVKIVPAKKSPKKSHKVVRVEVLPAKLQALGPKKGKAGERIKGTKGIMITQLRGSVGGESKVAKTTVATHCVRMSNGKIKPLKIIHCPRAKAAISGFAPSPSIITEDEVRGIIDAQEKAAMIGALKRRFACSGMGAELVKSQNMTPPRFVDDALHEEQMELFAKGGEQAIDPFLQDAVYGDVGAAEIMEMSEFEAGPSAALADRLLRQDQNLMRYKKVKGYDATEGVYTNVDRNINAHIFGGDTALSADLDQPDRTLHLPGVGFITVGELLTGCMVGSDNFVGTVGWFYDQINRSIDAEMFGDEDGSVEALFEKGRAVNPEEDALMKEERGQSSLIGEYLDVVPNPDILVNPGGLQRKQRRFTIGDYSKLSDDLLVSPGGLKRLKYKATLGTHYAMPKKYFAPGLTRVQRSNTIGWTPPREIAGDSQQPLIAEVGFLKKLWKKSKKAVGGGAKALWGAQRKMINIATSPLPKSVRGIVRKTVSPFALADAARKMGRNMARKRIPRPRTRGAAQMNQARIAIQNAARAAQQNIARGYAKRYGLKQPTQRMVLQAGAVTQKLMHKHGVPTTISGMTAYNGDVVGVPVEAISNSDMGSFLYYLNPASWFRSSDVNQLYLAKKEAAERKADAEKLKRVSDDVRRAWEEVNAIEESLATDIDTIAQVKKGETRKAALAKLRSGVLAGASNDEGYVAVGLFSELGFGLSAAKRKAGNAGQILARIRSMVQEARMLAGNPNSLPPVPGMQQSQYQQPQQQYQQPQPQPQQPMYAPQYAEPAYQQQPYYPEDYGYQDPYAQQYTSEPAYGPQQPAEYAQESYPQEYYQQDPYSYDPYAGSPYGY